MRDGNVHGGSKPCQRCNAGRVIRISAKCSDLFWMRWPKGKEQDGYVPRFLGIGGGDYVEFEYCLDCGQIQGVWPAKVGSKKVKVSEEEAEDDA